MEKAERHVHHANRASIQRVFSRVGSNFDGAPDLEFRMDEIVAVKDWWAG